MFVAFYSYLFNFKNSFWQLLYTHYATVLWNIKYLSFMKFLFATGIKQFQLSLRILFLLIFQEKLSRLEKS